MPRTAPLRAALLAAGTLAAACRPTPSELAGPPAADSTRIRRDVAWLADDAREGRGTGTAGNDSAAAYVARRFAALGLRPAGDSGYRQPFIARAVARQHAGQRWELPTANVVARLDGTDPALRDQVVIVGAHLDHLGRDTAGALDPEAKDAIRNGADDNASGTAAVLELARLFARQPARRTIVFVAFSGEELGLLGSAWFADHLPVPREQVVAMANFDMVGRLANDALQVYGVATAAELPAIVDSANVAPRFRLTATGDGFGSSDHASFYAKNLPVLHFFSGTHADYHRASDDAERINAGGEARIVDYAARVIRTIADRDARLTFQRAPEKPQPSVSAGLGAYFGSIPDMAAGDGTGLRLSGVRPGSPADKAGIRADDVVIAFGGKPVTDLYSYTNALGAFKPGAGVAVTIRRAGRVLVVPVVLGRRGG